MGDITLNLDFVRQTTLDTVVDTEIRSSKIHGFGLFALRGFNKGEIIGILDGQVISAEKYNILYERISHRVRPFQNYFFMECNYLKGNNRLARAFRTKYSFINHSHAPNIEIREPSLQLVILDDFSADDEILIDYTREELPEEYLAHSDNRYLRK